MDNVALGVHALESITTGDNNVAIGEDVLQNLTTSSKNTAVGYNALNDLETGDSNTAVGYNTLQAIAISATHNTAVGSQAMGGSTYGSLMGVSNTAFGSSALYNHTTGDNNVALGRSAMQSHRYGANNVAVGANTLYWNTDGTDNVAIGYNAGYNYRGSDGFFLANDHAAGNVLASGYFGTGDLFLPNGWLILEKSAKGIVFQDGTEQITAASTDCLDDLCDVRLGGNGGKNIYIGHEAPDMLTAVNNVALGVNALVSNVYGGYNVAVGEGALEDATNTSSSVAVGYKALSDYEYSTGTGGNVAVGAFAMETCSHPDAQGNTAIGPSAMMGGATYGGNEGAGNVALGEHALGTHVTGNFNTALGPYAMKLHRHGERSVAVGYDALRENTDGARNVAIGNKAGYGYMGSDGFFLANADAAGNILASGYFGTGDFFIPNGWLHLEKSDKGIVFQDGSKQIIAASSGTMTTVKKNNSQVGGADIVTLDFSNSFSVTESPDTEVQIGIDPVMISGLTDVDSTDDDYLLLWDNSDSALKKVDAGEFRGGGVPAGSMVAFGSNSIPTGWLTCQGQEVSRTTYADLFAVIGTTYGVGDGATTFDLPDLVHRYPRGVEFPASTDGVGRGSPVELGDTAPDIGGSTFTFTEDDERIILSGHLPTHEHLLPADLCNRVLINDHPGMDVEAHVDLTHDTGTEGLLSATFSHNDYSTGSECKTIITPMTNAKFQTIDPFLGVHWIIKY
jgi:microcystin-dependent protein